MENLAGFPRREAQAMGLIGFAHMLSHLYMLAFAPLAASIISDMQISAIEYGAALTAFAVVTGILQTPMGLLVERVGGRPILIFGLFVNSAAFCLIAWFSHDYLTFISFMALAGVGNSVFHPADYSLISATVAEERMGRAFSVHTFVGHVGFILGPILAAGLEPFIGWRGSIATIGIIGVSMSVVLILFGSVIADGNLIKRSSSLRDSLRELFSSRPVALFFLFYMLSSMANFGMVQFSVLAFQPLYGIEHVVAVAALTAYQVGTLALVIPGGILADRTSRYDFIMLLGFGISSVAILVAGSGWLPFSAVTILICIAGGMRGGVNASRDVAVRQIARRIPVGTVFAFVSTGFLVGQALSGFVYGFLFENYPPNYIFYASAVFSILGMVTVIFNQGARKTKKALGE